MTASVTFEALRHATDDADAVGPGAIRVYERPDLGIEHGAEGRPPAIRLYYGREDSAVLARFIVRLCDHEGIAYPAWLERVRYDHHDHCWVWTGVEVTGAPQHPDHGQEPPA